MGNGLRLAERLGFFLPDREVWAGASDAHAIKTAKPSAGNRMESPTIVRRRRHGSYPTAESKVQPLKTSKLGQKRLDRHLSNVAVLAAADADGAVFEAFVAQDQHVRRLVQLCLADFFAQGFAAVIH